MVIAFDGRCFSLTSSQNFRNSKWINSNIDKHYFSICFRHQVIATDSTMNVCHVKPEQDGEVVFIEELPARPSSSVESVDEWGNPPSLHSPNIDEALEPAAIQGKLFYIDTVPSSSFFKTSNRLYLCFSLTHSRCRGRCHSATLTGVSPEPSLFQN